MDKEKQLQTLVERLRKAYADRLVSVVLYGSAAVGDATRSSDLNVLCVLREVTPRELADSESIVRWWRDRGHPAPLFLAEREVAASTDCFPIEFHDITRHHRILDGVDLISGLEVDDSFYRAEVEHELRAKLLRLRQKATAILSDANLLRRLLAASLSTFLVLFRHALRLHGVDGAMKKREVIEQARATFGIDPAPFTQLLDLREELIKPAHVNPAQLLANYLKEIAVVIDAVDRLEK
ncbi:MAG: nucleotidyltransferase domain-containing protein [Bryobacteraceae bacterium]